jgi:hypothetical protein
VDVLIRKMDVNDDFNEVASLINIPLSHTMPICFRKSDQVTKAIPRIMRYENVEYNYHNFWLCFDSDGTLIGALQGYEPTTIDSRCVAKAFKNELNDPSFTAAYREWYNVTAPIINSGFVARIHWVYFSPGHGWDDAGAPLLRTFLDAMFKQAYNGVYFDIDSEDKKLKERLIRYGFKPERMITSDNFRINYLRMKINLTGSIDYMRIGLSNNSI